MQVHGMQVLKVLCQITQHKEFLFVIICLHLQVIEEQMKTNTSLFQLFCFSSQEAGAIEDIEAKKVVYHQLIEKMVHTHGNEFIQNRRMLTNMQSGKLDAPVMLRDTLKVIANQGNTQEVYNELV